MTSCHLLLPPQSKGPLIGSALNCAKWNIPLGAILPGQDHGCPRVSSIDLIQYARASQGGGEVAETLASSVLTEMVKKLKSQRTAAGALSTSIDKWGNVVICINGKIHGKM